MPLKGLLAETDTTKVEIAHKCTRATALETASHRSGRELRLFEGLNDHRFFCHRNVMHPRRL